MAKYKDRKVKIWIAVITAITAIIVSVIQIYVKSHTTEEINFKSKNINNSSVFIGNGNSVNKNEN